MSQVAGSPPEPDQPFSRRSLLKRAALGAAALSVPAGLRPAPAAAAGVIPLPTPAQLRADVQRMVDLGPRFTGTAGHERFIAWLERELTAAGVIMLPPDEEKLEVWEASAFGLEVLEGAAKGRAKVATYYPRSQETGAGGVTGPLVYAGTLPAPSVSLGSAPDPAAYSAAVASWAQAQSGRVGSTQGAVVLVDAPMPAPLTAGAFIPIASDLNWPGHTEAEFAAVDYKRIWIAPGVSGIPTDPFKGMGAAACVFILDCSYEALQGNYLPFENAFEDLPAQFVDRDTGNALRTAAGARPSTRLTLEATRRAGTSPALLGYLPGKVDDGEALFLNTHTDGEGFVEENGGIAFVHLARHLASLPEDKRLNRAVVFSLWPGHMATGMPQLGGVLAKHPDIVRSSVAGITVEHLGCTEWTESATKGYHATGEQEVLGVWTTQGKVHDITLPRMQEFDLRGALLRPPVQFGVGGALQSAGVPQIGFLAGPFYLLRDSADGDMDKFDGALAARQVAWVAALLRDLDGVPAATLAAGDPTLGTKSTGAKARFPAVAGSTTTTAPLRLTVVLDPVHRRRALTGTVTASRPVRVRLHVTIGRRRAPLADRLITLRGTTPTRFRLPLSVRAKLLLARAKNQPVSLTARAHDGARSVTSRAGRHLR